MQVFDQLEQFAAVPDAAAYCAHIFRDEAQSPVFRQLAGIILKNLLRRPAAAGSMSESARATALDATRGMLTHPSRPLRRAAAASASTIVTVSGWAPLAQGLIDALRSGDPAACDGALQFLNNIVEDSPSSLLVPSGSGDSTVSHVMASEVLSLLEKGAFLCSLLCTVP